MKKKRFLAVFFAMLIAFSTMWTFSVSAVEGEGESVPESEYVEPDTSEDVTYESEDTQPETEDTAPVTEDTQPQTQDTQSQDDSDYSSLKILSPSTTMMTTMTGTAATTLITATTRSVRITPPPRKLRPQRFITQKRTTFPRIPSTRATGLRLLLSSRTLPRAAMMILRLSATTTQAALTTANGCLFWESLWKQLLSD